MKRICLSTRMSSCSAYSLTWTLVFRGGGHEVFMEQHIYFPVTNIGLCKPDSTAAHDCEANPSHRLWYLPSVRSFLFNIPTLPIFSPFLPPSQHKENAKNNKLCLCCSKYIIHNPEGGGRRRRRLERRGNCYSMILLEGPLFCHACMSVQVFTK